MLTFNQLLRVGGLDPGAVRLLRHTASKEHHRTLFDAAIKGDPRFQAFQERQGDPDVIKHIRKAQHLAGFVVEPILKQTVFMGIWDVVGERPPTDDPITKAPPGPDTVAFKTQLRTAFDDYRGRLVIDWGGGNIVWVQRADKQDKPIVELRRRREDPAFPGFMSLRISLGEVETVPVSWAEVLRNARGVYLLVHRSSGDQYVGSATGEGGFYGRWKSYSDGHGGNVAMKQLGATADDYDATILDVIGTDATSEDVFARENLWKAKLGSRAKGLNRN